MRERITAYVCCVYIRFPMCACASVDVFFHWCSASLHTLLNGLLSILDGWKTTLRSVRLYRGLSSASFVNLRIVELHILLHLVASSVLCLVTPQQGPAIMM